MKTSDWCGAYDHNDCSSWKCWKEPVFFSVIICCFWVAHSRPTTTTSEMLKKDAEKTHKTPIKLFLIHSSRCVIARVCVCQCVLLCLCVFFTSNNGIIVARHNTEDLFMCYAQFHGRYFHLCFHSLFFFFIILFYLLLDVLTSPLKMLNCIGCNSILCWMGELTEQLMMCDRKKNDA